MCSCLYNAALWSRSGKGLPSWLFLVMFIVLFFFTFPCGILGQVWYLIVSFPGLCNLSYFVKFTLFMFLIHVSSYVSDCILKHYAYMYLSIIKISV